MKNVIITAFGHDHPGIVSQLTRIVTENKGNVEESRMTRLGGDFAMLLLVTLPAENFNTLQEDLNRVDDLTVMTRLTTAGKKSGLYVYQRFSLNGADHEGIVYSISDFLSKQKINIENMNTETVNAPVSGTVLFRMDGIIAVPNKMNLSELKGQLDDLGDSLGAEICLTDPDE